jgi:hypothetical protein
MKSAKNWRPRWDFRFSRQRIWRWLSSRTCSIVEINRRFKGAYCLHHHRLDDGDSNNLWNVGKFLPDYNIPGDSYLRGRPQWREQLSQSGLETVTSGTRRNFNHGTARRRPSLTAYTELVWDMSPSWTNASVRRHILWVEMKRGFKCRASSGSEAKLITMTCNDTLLEQVNY